MCVYLKRPRKEIVFDKQKKKLVSRMVYDCGWAMAKKDCHQSFLCRIIKETDTEGGNHVFFPLAIRLIRVAHIPRVALKAPGTGWSPRHLWRQLRSSGKDCCYHWNSLSIESGQIPMQIIIIISLRRLLVRKCVPSNEHPPVINHRTGFQFLLRSFRVLANRIFNMQIFNWSLKNTRPPPSSSSSTSTTHPPESCFDLPFAHIFQKVGRCQQFSVHNLCIDQHQSKSSHMCCCCWLSPSQVTVLAHAVRLTRTLMSSMPI